MSSRKVLISRRLTLISYFALLSLMIAWMGWLSPSDKVPAALTILLSGLPLLIPLRGLLAGRRLSHTLISFVALIYFAHGSMEAWSSLDVLDRQLALTEACLAVVLHLSSGFYVRFSAAGKVPSG